MEVDNSVNQENDQNLLVAIRVRPMNQRELNNNEMPIIKTEDNLIIVLDPVEVQFQQEQKQMLEVLHRSKEQRYAFDYVFTNESQESIYRFTCSHLIRPVLNGINATVFAYGPTGTGKTYTMIGNEENIGLSVLTIQDIFDHISKRPNKQSQVMISYVEIYNENIRDLLQTNSNNYYFQNNYLELRDDPNKGVVMTGVTEFKAENIEEVMKLLKQGNKRRTTEATNANMTSSRSHAVFQINIKSKDRTKNIEEETLEGKLSLIDLAGSERGTVTENRGIRLREGAKINRSLLALANCINALGEKNKKGYFVPYRDSKLTRLLKDSLGGNSRTVMIANISPSSGGFEETINTLKYANRAKNIKTKSKVNRNMVNVHISEYKNIIEDLREEILQLKQQLITNINQDDQAEHDLVNHNQNIPNHIKCQKCEVEREDELMVQQIQQEIIENFQERIQLRKSLMELEQQNANNQLEIRQRQSQLIDQKNSIKKQSSQQQDINVDNQMEFQENKKLINTLRTNSDKNNLKKELLDLQLLENSSQSKKIRQDIQKKIKSFEKRKYLELVIKNHILELQNIELEINLQIQEKSIFDLQQIVTQQQVLIEHQGKQIKQKEGKEEKEKDNNAMIEITDDYQYEDLQNEEDMKDLEDFQQMIECERMLIDQIKQTGKKKQRSEKSLKKKKK